MAKIEIIFPSSSILPGNINHNDLSGLEGLGPEYIHLNQEEYDNLNDILSNTLVTSVNGEIGDVVLDYSDVNAAPTIHTHTISQITNLQSTLDSKQNNLVSGTNIKTIEGQTLLGSGNIDLSKTDVGLGNVDNTSDLLKPISNATQTALNLKADDANVVHKTGDESISGIKTFNNNIQLAPGLQINTAGGAGGNIALGNTTDPMSFGKANTNAVGFNYNIGGSSTGLFANYVVGATGIGGIRLDGRQFGSDGIVNNDFYTLGQANIALATKQDNLISGTSIKTIEGQNILGSGNIDLNKSDVGLNNVDNTSDINKPVSTLQQIAIDSKVAQTITNGVTTSAPSQDAVFDALVLKADDINVLHTTGDETYTGIKKAFKGAPIFTEYYRTDIAGTSKVSVGMLGAPEANLSFNMDYTTNVHKYYDATKGANWLALSANVFAIQYAPPGASTSGDMWNDTGQRYSIWGESSTGRFAINTSIPDNKGDAQFYLPRTGSIASIGGKGDLVLEGDRVKGTSAPVYINTYNAGNIFLANGGGKVSVGFLAPLYQLDVQGISRVKRLSTNGGGLSISNIVANDAKTVNDGVGVLYQGYNSADTEVPYASTAANIESNTVGAQSGSFQINTYNAGVRIKALNATKEGRVEIFAAPINSTDAVRKLENDLKANIASPTFTGVPLSTTAAAGTNTTQIATTAFVTSALNIYLKTGTSTQSGNGSTTSFTIAHGLGVTPTYFNVNATSSAAANISYVTANSTNLTVFYTVAPVTGTNNLTWNWITK